ncbi:MAG: uroporphyrinogen decarboxylase family protein [Acidobacteria bacterium]|nr:uroporphyrinogen decarboxylase family protein [Acidobacteriota bacterium]
MTGRQRIFAALSGERPDTTPVMLHNFMAAAREAGVRMKEYRRDPRAIARVFVRAVETYGYDGVLVYIDTATLAGALGVPVEYPDDEPAVCRGALLDELRDVDRLPPPDVARHEGVQVWLEAVRILKRELGQEYFIRGNCDQAAFSLAALVRSAEAWMLDLMDPAGSESALRLLDYCHKASEQFLRLMAEAGADMLSNGDSSAGTSLISPGLHRRFAHPYEARLAGLAHDLGLPYALHVCGNARAILGDLCRTGADALELDFKTDAAAARDALGGRVTFIGNIDPTGVMAMGTPAVVGAKCRELMELFAGTPRFILNAGCALPAGTPPANIHAMVRAARA